MDTIKLYTDYFTYDVCDALRERQLKFDDAWKNYVIFHKSKGIFDSKKAIYIMEQFKFLFEENNKKPPPDFQTLLKSYNIEC